MLKIFSIYDSKANAFMQPFFSPNVSVAKRTVMRALMDPDSDFGKFKEDFSLFEFGEWDPMIGKFDMRDAGENHGLLSSFFNLEVAR